ncbi:hypothetical protein PSTG_09324 [Puccinia striiformis f. sp. tritici PST-78]|uniref:Uncharacterized protein n=1 Tax=Puccinia striiformis f. sp. tritici PST-78 TaxID=1165861 RepID=A0A0L0VDS3_9BASI|nr:hypothetical protein PSTG_09324 [Puccinia striiformis f. sp. tritici PST-78]
MKDEGCLPPFCRFNSAALGQTHQTTLVLQTYIRSWQQSVHRPASKSKSQLTYTNGQTIIIQTDHRLTLVDKMILSSQLSDLDLLQLQWTLDLPTLEKLITRLTEKNSYSIRSSTRRISYLDRISEKDHPTSQVIPYLNY